MSGIANMLYQGLFKRTSTFAATVIFGAFFFERSFELGSDCIFDTINKGKLWAHIKDKYEVAEE